MKLAKQFLEKNKTENKPEEEAAFGVTDEELTGILSLVNGMPEEWNCHVTHNKFDVLQETEETQDQASTEPIEPTSVPNEPKAEEPTSVPSEPKAEHEATASSPSEGTPPGI